MKAFLGMLLIFAPSEAFSQASDPFLLSFGVRTPQEMGQFLHDHNPSLSLEFCLDLAQIYVEEAAEEGVNHDLAFAQMCLETNYMRFGGQVRRVQNNFAGLGALDDGSEGLFFPDERTGVRAQIQHLKAYGSDQPLVNPLVDPRFGFIQRGVAPVVTELTLRWASDPQYSEKIRSILHRLEQS